MVQGQNDKHGRWRTEDTLDSSEMWYWRRMEISWTDRVRSEAVLHRVKEERKIVQTIKRRKNNWICHILGRNCLLKYVIEGKISERIELTGGRGRSRKQPLDDRKYTKACWKLKRKTLDGTLRRTRSGRT
jgi:hypothetical protein